MTIYIIAVIVFAARRGVVVYRRFQGRAQTEARGRRVAQGHRKTEGDIRRKMAPKGGRT